MSIVAGKKENKHKPHTHDQAKITGDKASTLNTKAKSTKIGSKETESNILIADNNGWC